MRAWLWQSQGADIRFELVGGEGAALAPGTQLSCFTTRPDTLFGVTHVVVAPEHPLVAGGLVASAQVRPTTLYDVLRVAISA